MEAAPRLPMISFDLKTSSEPVSFGPKLKQYIASFYHEDPESYSGEIQQLEELRSGAVRPTCEVSGVQLVKRYYCQLLFLRTRFPIGKGGPCAPSFSWRDAYAGVACSAQDLELELMAVLYNVGALHSQLGAADSRQSAEGMKMACTHFQCAAWALQKCREQYPQHVTLSLAPEPLHFMEIICLAQAQECILEKSMSDGRKCTIIAKVAAQAAEYYNQACSALTGGQPDQPSDCPAAEVIGGRLVKDWCRYARFKSAYHFCISLLYQGQQSEEQQKMGERVALYQAAAEKLEEARKLSSSSRLTSLVHASQGEIEEALAFTGDVVEGKRKAARNENEFIYHEHVPEKDSLPHLQGASLVRPVPFGVSDPDVCGPDIFGRLVPMEAHEASSMYSERKAMLVRAKVAACEQKDQELEDFMTSLHSLECLTERLARPQTIPQELVDRAAALSARPQAAQALVDAMGKLSAIHHDVDALLTEANSLIEKDREAAAANNDGKPQVSQPINDLSRETTKYREALSKANESNEALHRAMSAHVANLRILSQPLSALDRHVPRVALPEPQTDGPVLSELRKLLSKVDEMRSQRGQLLQKLREDTQQDDITGRLVIAGKDKPMQELEKLFTTELAKHQPQVLMIEQNLSAQQNILQALTDTYAKLSNARKHVSDAFRRRDQIVSALIASYDAYEDLLAKANKGIDFYQKLETNVTKLLQRLRSTCRVQEEEREQKSLSTQPASTGAPKLRDYLQQPRPAPVGSEHTDISKSIDQNNLRTAYSQGKVIMQHPGYQKPNLAHSVTTPSLSTVYTTPEVAPSMYSNGKLPYSAPKNYLQDPKYGHDQNIYGKLPTGAYPSNATQQLSFRPETGNAHSYVYTDENYMAHVNNYGTPYSLNQPASGETHPVQSSTNVTQKSTYNQSHSGQGIPAVSLRNSAMGYVTGTLNYGQTISTLSHEAGYPGGSSISYGQSISSSKAESEMGQPSGTVYSKQGGSYPNNNYNPSASTSNYGQSVNSYPIGSYEQSISSSSTSYPIANYGQSVLPTPVPSGTGHPIGTPDQPVLSTHGQSTVGYPVGTHKPPVSSHFGPPGSDYPTASLTTNYENQKNLPNATGYPVTSPDYRQQVPSSGQSGYTQSTTAAPVYYGKEYASVNYGYPQVPVCLGQVPSGASLNYSTPSNVSIPSDYNFKLNLKGLPEMQNYGQQPPAGYSQKHIQPNIAPISSYPNSITPNVAYQNPNQANVPNTNYVQENAPNSSYQNYISSANNQESTPNYGYNNSTTFIAGYIRPNQENVTNMPYHNPGYSYQKETSISSPITGYPNSNPSSIPSSVYVQPSIQGSASNTSYQNVNTSVSAHTEPVVPVPKQTSNIDLLAGLDFNVSQVPLDPVKAEENPPKEEIKSNIEERPKQVTPKPLDEVDIQRAKGKFAYDIEQLEKWLISEEAESELDNRWRELQIKFEKDCANLSISVARCYPNRNRCPDSLPYDKNRFELLSPPANDDYINASRIPGTNAGCPPMLLTQAPLPNTVDDFWMMIQQSKAAIVVCLMSDGELTEAGLSGGYWSREQGVTLIKEASKQQYWIERELNVGRSPPGHKVVHIQLECSWQGAGFDNTLVYDSMASLALELINRSSQSSGLVVIHCTRGSGRSGALCLLLWAAGNMLAPAPRLLNLQETAPRLATYRRNALRDRQHLAVAYRVLLRMCRILVPSPKPPETLKQEEVTPTPEPSPKDPLSDLDPLWKLKIG